MKLNTECCMISTSEKNVLQTSVHNQLKCKLLKKQILVCNI